MRKFVIFLLALFVVPTIGFAADSFKKYVRPDAPKVTQKDHIVIMPIDLNLGVANEEEYIPAIMGGIKAVLKDQGTSLQPLASAGMDKTARRFVGGIVHMVSFHEAYDFTEDSTFHGGKSELPALMNDVVTTVETAKKQFGIKDEVNYIILARASKKGKSISKKIGFVTIKATTVKVAAAIYNVKEQKIDRVIIYEKVGELNAILGGIGKEVKKNLMK